MMEVTSVGRFRRGEGRHWVPTSVGKAFLQGLGWGPFSLLAGGTAEESVPSCGRCCPVRLCQAPVLMVTML